MGKVSTFVGLDVHKKRIAVAVARAGGQAPEWWGMVEHTPEGVGKLVKRLGEPGDVLACYEAGPCGHTLRRRLESVGIATIVVAPSLIPRKPGERVKTDRKDALKLAKELRSGDLTAVWTLDPAQEALRDLTRAREAVKGDLHRIRQRITKMLLRLGIEEPAELKTRWTQKYERWVAGLRFDLRPQQVVWDSLLEGMEQAKARLRKLEEGLKEAARGSSLGGLIGGLQCIKGIGLISAVMLVAELGDIWTRFPMAQSLMGYAGLGAKEWSSGEKQRRGGITKAGNAHVRFVAVEAGWHYQHAPRESKALNKRREGQPEAVVAIAKKAEERLHKRFRHLVRKGKVEPCAVTAVGRELLGVVWAIAAELASIKAEAAAPERAAA